MNFKLYGMDGYVDDSNIVYWNNWAFNLEDAKPEIKVAIYKRIGRLDN